MAKPNCIFCGGYGSELVLTGSMDQFAYPMCFYCSRVIRSMFPDHWQSAVLHTNYYATKRDRKKAVKQAERVIDFGRRGRDNQD